MAFNFRIHNLAKKELYDSFQWYENKAEGLGIDFYIEVEKEFRNIISKPYSYPKYEDVLRKAVLLEFPFNILFDYKDNTVFVHAILHHKRSNKNILKRKFKS
jgi:hypothetical protein